MPPHDFLNHLSQLGGFVEWGDLAELDKLAGNSTGGRFFAQISKYPDQFCLRVGVNNGCRRELTTRIHSHV